MNDNDDDEENNDDDDDLVGKKSGRGANASATERLMFALTHVRMRRIPANHINSARSAIVGSGNV